MSYWREEELTAQGVATKTTLKIRFNQKIYVRVKTLPWQFYEQGQKLEAEYAAQNLDSLLIKHKNWIAIWREELNQLEEIEQNYGELRLEGSFTSADENFPLTDLPQKSALEDEDYLTPSEFETKVPVKKYRGVIARDDCAHFSKSSHNLDQPQQLNKKYRGVAYKESIPDYRPRKVTQSKPIPKKYRGRSY